VAASYEGPFDLTTVISSYANEAHFSLSVPDVTLSGPQADDCHAMIHIHVYTVIIAP